jgi:hypothetical protein
MAITKWLHYADHALAPICRSRPGSNMPIADTPRSTHSLPTLSSLEASSPTMAQRSGWTSSRRRSTG